MNLALQKIMSMPDGVLTIDDPEIIQAAWGPRRVSGRTRGMDLAAYPKSVTAAKGLWARWVQEVRPMTTVIAKKKAQARIDAALAHTRANPEDQQTEPASAITQDEIDDMLTERLELRAAKQWADADKIRNYLVAHGVTVSDDKVAK